MLALPTNLVAPVRYVRNRMADRKQEAAGVMMPVTSPALAGAGDAPYMKLDDLNEMMHKAKAAKPEVAVRHPEDASVVRMPEHARIANENRNIPAAAE